MALSSGGLVTIDCLPPEIGVRRAKTAAAERPEMRLIADRPNMEELQRRYLQLILEETGWNRRRAAAVLDLDRRTIQRLIARYQLHGAADPEGESRTGNGGRIRGKAHGYRVRERKWGVPHGCPVPIVAVALALLSAFSSHAQSTAVVARAAGVTGQAVLLSPGLAPLALTAGYILNPGDRIDTRGGGRVVIDLSDGSMVVVSPESLVTLKDYRAAASLRELFGITLGMVRVKINHFAGKPNPTA